MPELPEVETVRRELAPVMEQARFTGVILRRDGLRRPFPPDFAARLTRRRVRAISRRGKIAATAALAVSAIIALFGVAMPLALLPVAISALVATWIWSRPD